MVGPINGNKEIKINFQEIVKPETTSSTDVKGDMPVDKEKTTGRTNEEGIEKAKGVSGKDQQGVVSNKKALALGALVALGPFTLGLSIIMLWNVMPPVGAAESSSSDSTDGIKNENKQPEKTETGGNIKGETETREKSSNIGINVEEEPGVLSSPPRSSKKGPLEDFREKALKEIEDKIKNEEMKAFAKDALKTELLVMKGDINRSKPTAEEFVQKVIEDLGLEFKK